MDPVTIALISTGIGQAAKLISEGVQLMNEHRAGTLTAERAQELWAQKRAEYRSGWADYDAANVPPPPADAA